ncbi:MAG: nitroreductase family protein [Chloroflexi bacterium]|nr:nitroreductase family protein [Chloroflexota bacterium]
MKVDYSHDNLMKVDETVLRAMIRERTHITVEQKLYRAIAKGKPLPANTGATVRKLLAAWNERGLPTDAPDFVFVKATLDMAERSSRGESIDLSPFACKPFDKEEAATARRLLKERRSIRHWTDEEVPDEMIDQVLQAALWAPHGTNLCSLRFLVVREKNEPGLFRGSFIPGGPVHIVACQDRRVYYADPSYEDDPAMGENKRVLDCGAAMQNMVLMAYSLGLGPVWLTFSSGMRERLRARFGLADYLEMVTYLDLGFPALTPMPPGRMALNEVVLARV